MLGLTLTQWLRDLNVQDWTAKGRSFPPTTFQLAASGLAHAFLPRRVALRVDFTAIHRASRRDQHSRRSFAKRANPHSLGRNKEIQIFKLMGIRSLWLIRESGEKMILPWTGLERIAPTSRPSVERSPPKPSIRQHLPLLR